jgi:hypothetical protein
MTRHGFSGLIPVGLSVCALIACAASNDGSNGTPAAAGTGSSSAGTASTPTAGTAATPTAGSTGSVAGGTSSTTGGSGSVSSAGTGGTGGSGPTVTLPLCTTKLTPTSTSIADFETYDGTTAAKDFSWIFGGPMPAEPGVQAGAYSFGDGSATPVLSLLAGHAGNFGLSVAVTGAAQWGMGFGMFLLDPKASYGPACINASAYKGVTMWVRGSVPTGTFSFGVSMAQSVLPAKGGSCTGTDDMTCKGPTATGLPITETWSQVDVLWTDMLGGLNGTTELTTSGDNITGFSFGANLTFMPESEGSETYVPVPGDISVVIDDLAFIP